jgi:hypothetical protein
MDQLRPDVREAFAEKQAELGNVAAARVRLIRDALAAREAHKGNRMQFAAGIAAIVIAALVIATFAYVRAGVGVTHHGPPLPATSPRPNATPSPTALSGQINVPFSTPVILYHDPASFDQIDGMTWDGKISGRVGAGATNGGIGNPQGSLYSTSTDIRNRFDQVLATYSGKDLTFFWADDGIHYCALVRTASRDVSSSGQLMIAEPSGPPRNIARIGTFPPASSNGGGPNIVACSPGSDRAGVYQSGGQGTGVTQFWVLQLSTGRVIWTGGSGGWIAASHDGRFVALSAAPDDSTVFGDTGASIAHVASTVFGFSWDATFAVVASNFSSSPSVVRWRDGTAVWAAPSGNGYAYWQSFAEPGGARLAIGVLDPKFPQTGGFAPADLYVISPDGAVVFERNDVFLFTQ